MRQKIFILISFLILIFVFYSIFKLINRPVEDNDEGIYLTTFILVNKGYKLYSQVFFSQLPGFFLAVYPGFLLFGKSIQAVRLTVFLWAIISLIGVFWLTSKLRKPFIGLLTILILFSISSYFKQIVTFQSDALALSFSTLSLVFIWKFKSNSNKLFLIISSIFFSLAFWTKLDISIIVPLTLILFKKDLLTTKINIRDNKSSTYLLFVASFLIISMILVVPFGIKEVINNVFVLRSQALAAYPFEPNKVFELLKSDLILLLIIILSLIFTVFLNSNIKKLISVLLVWAIISFCLLFVYRPVLPHHLIFLTVPFSLLFVFLISDHKWLKYSAVCLWLFVALFLAYTNIQVKDDILSRDQKTGIEIIKKYTKPNDFVISDEAILNAESGRLPPPELVDISFVRIKSGNLSSKKFNNIVERYKPKLIIAWNGRLDSMHHFSVTLEKNYKLFKTLDNNKNIYSLNSLF